MLVKPDDPGIYWLLVRTKPKQETALVRSLGVRGVSAYCPLVLEPRAHPRAPKGPVPLFPGYVFARCSPSTQRAAVDYCAGAAGLVRFGEYLAAVEEAFIGFLRVREEGRGYLLFAETRKPLTRGSRVKVVRGPFAGYQGIVSQYLPSKDRVRLLLELVSRPVQVELSAADVATLRR